MDKTEFCDDVSLEEHKTTFRQFTVCHNTCPGSAQKREISSNHSSHATLQGASLQKKIPTAYPILGSAGPAV